MVEVNPDDLRLALNLIDRRTRATLPPDKQLALIRLRFALVGSTVDDMGEAISKVKE